MNNEIFATNLKAAFLDSSAEQVLSIINEYFGEYDSYVKKDVISLLVHQMNFNSMNLRAILLENNVKKINDEIADNLDTLIEKLIIEKEQIYPENYEKILGEIKRLSDMFANADKQKFDTGLAFCERFYTYYNDDLKHQFNEGIRIENPDSDRVIKNNLISKNDYAIITLFSQIKGETEIIYKGANDTPERLHLQKLLSKNKMNEVLVELSPKMKKKKFSSLEWEVLELRCKLRKLGQQKRLGMLMTKEFMQKRYELYAHLTTLIFHKEEEKQPESRLQKLLRFFKLK